jgi:hypothetical protein
MYAMISEMIQSPPTMKAATSRPAMSVFAIGTSHAIVNRDHAPITTNPTTKTRAIMGGLQ